MVRTGCGEGFNLLVVFLPVTLVTVFGCCLRGEESWGVVLIVDVSRYASEVAQRVVDSIGWRAWQPWLQPKLWLSWSTTS